MPRMARAFSLPEFPPEDTVFLAMSFEGPDVYSQAGGLGVRMAEITRALAEEGHETHLFFVGDPGKPAIETSEEGRLFFHRWGQWISRYHPHGVYDGEEGKMADYQSSLPRWIAENFFASGKRKKSRFVIMGEEWHTAGAVIALSLAARAMALKDRAVFLWNANNTFGFHRLDFPLLKRSAALTTVSKYMKHLMRDYGLEPLVIPNGIPERWFRPLSPGERKALREAAGGEILLAKVGRFDPGKRWLMAIQAIALLKRLGLSPRLLMRGGMEPHGGEVRMLALSLGLSTAVIKLPKNAPISELFRALRENSSADIYDLQFFVPEETLRTIYHAADAVLANSSHEPFGLVGLEVMSCKGVAITGSTGEDYAQNFHNAIVVDSDDPRELAAYLAMLANEPKTEERLRKAGHESAKTFLWSRVIEDLKRKLAYVALAQAGNIE